VAPLTKKKSSKSHTRERRAHLAIKMPQLVNCPNCNTPKLPHEACPTCGTYNGRNVIDIKSTAKKTE
jgi:large subunit ribosomal protein L32